MAHGAASSRLSARPTAASSSASLPCLSYVASLSLSRALYANINAWTSVEGRTGHEGDREREAGARARARHARLEKKRASKPRERSPHEEGPM